MFRQRSYGKVANEGRQSIHSATMNCRPRDQPLRHIDNSYRMGVASLFVIISAKQLSYVI